MSFHEPSPHAFETDAPQGPASREYSNSHGVDLAAKLWGCEELRRALMALYSSGEPQLSTITALIEPGVIDELFGALLSSGQKQYLTSHLEAIAQELLTMLSLFRKQTESTIIPAADDRITVQ